MAYQSKYTGLQIDDILDSVEWKQDEIEDLASIRAGAAKGATALQSYTEKYTGTVTGIKINGVVKSGSGVIDLGTISTDISGKQDKLVDGVNIATINGQSLTEGGDLTIKGGSQTMVATTWSELKELRDSASLVAGTWYRITDYVTTTSQSGTRSLEHPFDVVVLATGENTLSEEARAVRHMGDISMSVSLMGIKFFYKGVLIVDGVEWFEFESPDVSLVASSATPAIGDIVYPYFDGMIVTEEAYPIESVSESENEYFLNNNASLDSWKIWYCLDNDKNRFPWAYAKTNKQIVVNTNTASYAEYNGTYYYEGVLYHRWDSQDSSQTYSVSFLTTSDNPSIGDIIPFYGIVNMGFIIIMECTFSIDGIIEPSTSEGFGVIYRMIDEKGNDCPYDFKNIQFLTPVLDGQFDDENGIEEWVFTFNLYTANNVDYSCNTLAMCYNNIIKSATSGLNFNIFLNTSGIMCYNNTLGNNCMHNVFNDKCYNNTLGNECMYNLFESNICNCNVASNVQYETIAVNNFGYTTEARVAYDSSNTLKIYCEADVTGDYNDLINTPTIDTEMSSSSTNAVQNKVIKSYIDSNCNIPIETTTSSTKSLTANIYYKWSNTPTSITITLTTPTNTNILNNYMFEFTASSSGCTLSVPSSIKWLNEIPPVIEPSKTYQISIINNLATVAKFG